MTDRSFPVRPLAMYLPQFHPIPENDEWWGKGFTEWTHVVQARPLFRWHDQPHLPADLGFCDLRLSEVREAQAALAAQYGIFGFCYYHYWFHGRRLLHRPFDEVLESGKPDFPFCLCWANESWVRVWEGEPTKPLVVQTYDAEDDHAHGRWLCRAFADPRYVRVDGKPFFLVYRVTQIPEPARTAEIWREEARKAGIGEIVLGAFEIRGLDRTADSSTYGFDVTVEFQPDWRNLGRPLRYAFDWRYRKDRRWSKIYDYAQVVERMLAKPASPIRHFRGITPGWDNTARRATRATRGAEHVILRGSTPQLYRSWLERLLERFDPPEPGWDLLFINAWNEWGEGNHLEPGSRWGLAYLEATRDALEAAARRSRLARGGLGRACPVEEPAKSPAGPTAGETRLAPGPER